MSAVLCACLLAGVWPAGETLTMNDFVGFRGDFAARGGDRIEMRLASSGPYRVFVNGRMIHYGPARGPNGWFREDVLDLSDAARPGANAIAVEVLGYNIDTYYVPKSPSFFSGELKVNGESVLTTERDGDFRATPLPKVRKCSRYSAQRGFGEAYAVMPESWDWRTGTVTRVVAVEKTPPVKILPRRVPLPLLEIRTLKAVGETAASYDRNANVKTAGFVEEVDGVKYLGYPKRELDVNIWDEMQKAGGGTLFDGGRNDTGFLRLSVDCAKPGRLVVTFDEILVGGKIDPTRLGCANAIIYDLTAPGTYELENFEPNTFRFAQVAMLTGKCKIRRATFRAYKGIGSSSATFSSSDSAIDRVFEAARETFAQNAVDVFTDCPSRERAGWLCDSFFTARTSRLLTGGLELEDLFLENYALPESFDVARGMVPMCYPADHPGGRYIPNWAMWLVFELDEYKKRGGDAAIVARMRPRVERLVEFFRHYRNSDGLLEKLDSWVFIEWSRANRWVQDVSYPSNMAYAEMLDCVDRLYGRPDLAQEAVRIRDTVRRQSWNGKWFRDHAIRRKDGTLDVPDGDISETCQYYAFFFGVATPESHADIWNRLVEDFGPDRATSGRFPEVAPANAFIGNYLRLECLSRAGRPVKVFDEVRGYFLGMADKTGTLWEHDRHKASCCHGFASHVAVSILRDVLGLKSVDHARKTVELDDREVPLDWCSATLPTADGELRIGWRKEKGRRRWENKLPIGWRVAGHNGVNVRVEKRSGSPRIVVDGETVPARMFWGRSNCRRIPLGKEWRRHEFKITPQAQVKYGLFRFMFPENAEGSFEVRNLRVDSPDGAARAVEVRSSGGKYPGATTPTMRFERGVTYTVSLDIRGEGLEWFRISLQQQEDGPYRYHSVDVPWDDPGMTTLCADARQALKSGCRFVTYFAPSCWFPDGAENWAPFDSQVRQLLSVDPNVLVIPRVSVNAPEWWCKTHPDDLMVMEDGPAGNWASVSSRVYRKEAGEYLRKVVRHFMETFPDNFAGIHFSGQNTAEWFYWKSQHKLFGYDKWTREAFRRYLRKYCDDPDWAAAEVPSPDERHAGKELPERFFDPVRQKRLLEFNRFLQIEMADAVGELARICREETKGRKLVLTFYGYSWEHSWNGIGPANTGHYGLMRMLSKWGRFIDALSGPQSYSGRAEVGGVSSVMSPAETMMRNGVLWIDEDDLRVHAVAERNVQSYYDMTADVHGDSRVMTRTVGMEAARGIGGWWMDLFGSGWYSDPKTWEIARGLHRFEREMMDRPVLLPEIAAVCDEESVIALQRMQGGNVPAGNLLRRAREMLPKTGFSFGQYLLDDVLANPPSVKAELHFGTWRPRSIDRLLAHVRSRPDITRLWCWAPPAEATGFRLEQVETGAIAVRTTEKGRSLGLGDGWSAESKVPIAPLYRVADAKANETLATWPDGSAAVAVRRNAKGMGWSVFCGIPAMTPELIAYVGRLSGAHAHLPREMVGKAVVWPGNGFVTLQAIEDSSFTLDMNRTGRIVDAISGRSYGDGPLVKVTLSAGDVLVLTQRPTTTGSSAGERR